MLVLDVRRKPKSDELVLIQFDSDFILETTYELALKFGLKKGLSISSEKFQQVKLASEMALALRQALSYLSRRIHTQKELSIKLQKKGFSTEAIEATTKQLHARGILNETAYAETFIESRKRKLLGTKKLSYELKQRGVAPEAIATALRSTDYEEPTLCRQAAEKKFRLLQHVEDKQKLKQKLCAHLMRKGFAWEHIAEALAELGV
ncbi:regulatory protein RecX [Chloroherpeton thalassium ATCC 35110]|uniref:Regulatory protein RecX n=1 Tax=Chloroherpeton thalassium (strain ATCC 35110 / GB-78) TaxID=517418 RepID=B3QV43_CHLT3|nr:regulatory protein RecX [Chloroherpeton thalassium]ACF12997.1 regulatory protein RecX [Chloroherpeton thalassium ATCC 35110]